ncbi:FtsQ-type POTRA domain-containing protein [Micromonospora sp. NPDC049559]|uniref:cell division protein FtsQ/DivIB n=1 Tax=Micromonospora sp. NPDC049559 TaxID=3155923 RepID=UPI00342F9007
MTPGSARGGRAPGSTDGPTGPGGRGGRPAVRRWRLVRANSDAVPASARRFMRRARQRRLRAALPWALIGGVLALAGLAAWVLTGTGIFGVREVRVVGAALVTPAEVRAAAAVPDGEPLATVDLAAVGGRVAALAPVARAEVSREWPRTLRIEVVERTPAAAVPQGEHFAVVDAEGVVFSTAPRRPDGLPLVRVANPGRNDPATRAALQVLGVLTPQLREQLAEVVVDGPARIRVQLRGGRTVIWGDATAGETKARAATSLLSRRGNTIDVSAPEVVSVR